MRVVGNFKFFSKQKSINGFDVRPVENFNEIYEHLADVMYAHLAMTKGPLVVRYYGNNCLPNSIWSVNTSLSSFNIHPLVFLPQWEELELEQPGGTLWPQVPSCQVAGLCMQGPEWTQV